MKDQLVPEIRFKEFEGKWERKKFRQILDPVSNPVEVLESKDYYQIGVRSHGKGIFHKESVTGKELGNKRVFWVVPHSIIFNIVFAWEGALAITSDEEDGKIASHRFPMYQSKGNQTSINYLKYYLGTKRGTALLKLASPGGAGRNKTLGKENFYNTKVPLSSLPEQQKIATFLTLVDRRLAAARRRVELLGEWKHSVSDLLFSSTDHWITKKLGDVADFQKGKGISKADITENGTTQCIRYGELYTTYSEVINYIFSTTDVPIKELIISTGGEVLIPASGETAIDIATAACVTISGVALGSDMNILTSDISGVFLAYYLSGPAKIELARLAQGVSVMHLYGRQLSELKIKVPAPSEQTHIANILSTIDSRITAAQEEVVGWEKWKQGLLQKMMV